MVSLCVRGANCAGSVASAIGAPPVADRGGHVERVREYTSQEGKAHHRRVHVGPSCCGVISQRVGTAQHVSLPPPHNFAMRRRRGASLAGSPYCPTPHTFATLSSAVFFLSSFARLRRRRRYQTAVAAAKVLRIKIRSFDATRAPLVVAMSRQRL